jgi:predicted 2-oxoglutarate/Fe(II)-dependent dioxygenase YbiX
MNILIQPNVVSKEGINFLIEHAKNTKKERMGVFDPHKANEKKINNSSSGQGKIDLNIRDVESADISNILEEVKDLYQNIVDYVINPHYGFKINDSEIPQLLVYGKGGHYNAHVDGVSKWKNPDGSIIWKKSADRDLSTVIFLNDDFEGGEFVFPELRIRIRPEPGLLIAFPSSEYYLHKVEPVISGTRYAMVNWMTIQGMKTMEQVNKELEAKYGVKVY